LRGDTPKRPRDGDGWKHDSQRPIFGAIEEKRALSNYLHQQFEDWKMQTERAVWLEQVRIEAAAAEKLRIRTIMSYAFNMNAWDTGYHFAFVDPIPVEEAIPKMYSAHGAIPASARAQ